MISVTLGFWLAVKSDVFTFIDQINSHVHLRPSLLLALDLQKLKEEIKTSLLCFRGYTVYFTNSYQLEGTFVYNLVFVVFFFLVGADALQSWYQRTRQRWEYTFALKHR